ncbi:CtsR family transcriptional regulator [Alicyclobacillus tolerans]|uniref:Transcriptional regulator CtsR n=1 Tax=Alicyclobacillus tolerans TaxID=90970 RepID=A0A1M6VME6_9BACL|nr:CtsR family transcriptional regulator [Alicyclobacillus montanus]SHK82670.1 transcriptional regulator [Alicyclobacillus montanus]
MARNITDIIESHLKSIMNQSCNGIIELQRSELADLFKCVPSQINYVISTRFTLEKGYIVESKRGGGGYIRIRQIESLDDPLMQVLQDWPSEISQREAEDMIERLEREQVMTEREANLMRMMVKREVLAVDLPIRDRLRSRLLKFVLQVFLMENGNEEEKRQKD